MTAPVPPPPPPPPYWSPAQPPPSKWKPWHKKVLIGCGVGFVGLILLSTCAPDPVKDAREAAETATPSAETKVPAYKKTSGEKPSTIIVTVDTAVTQEDAEAIIADLQRTHIVDDGYFVLINCSTGGTEGLDNRLANGKFAVGAIGAARTGLDDGSSEVTLNAGRECPAPTAAVAEAPAVTDDEVRAVFQKFYDERAEAGVMIAQSVTTIEVDNGVVTVHINPNPVVLELIPSDDLADFFGVPVAFDDEQSTRLRSVVQRVDVVDANGVSLGSVSSEELHRKATGG